MIQLTSTFPSRTIPLLKLYRLNAEMCVHNNVNVPYRSSNCRLQLQLVNETSFILRCLDVPNSILLFANAAYYSPTQIGQCERRLTLSPRINYSFKRIKLHIGVEQEICIKLFGKFSMSYAYGNRIEPILLQFECIEKLLLSFLRLAEHQFSFDDTSSYWFGSSARMECSCRYPHNLICV